LTNIHEYPQYNKYTPVFHSPVNRSWQKYSVRRGDGAGNDDTRCPETSDAMFAQQPAVDGLGDEGQVSEPGGSQVQHRSHGLLAAAGTSRQMMSTTTRQWLVAGSEPRQPNVSSPTWTKTSSMPHTQYSRLADHRRRLRSRTVITCPELLHDRLK